MKRKTRYAPLDINYFLDRSMPEPNSGCWIWMMAAYPNGYGAMRVGGKTRNAHRFAFAVATGRDVGGLGVCHKCDNRLCVNPDHLFLGTRGDNMRDCSQKGRVKIPGMAGEQLTQSKFTEAEVLKIRTDSRSNRALARFYGVDKGTISCIRRRLTWKHV
jgi:hypothetical protein